MAAKHTPRPTASQLAALKNLAEGRHIAHGTAGRAAHGGLTNTIYALQRAGWVDKGGITPAGRAALKGASPSEGAA